MQIGVKILVGVAAVSAGVLGLSSLGVLKSENRRAYREHVYYFYPKSNLYYDSSGARYIFYDSSAQAWKKSKQIPVLAKDTGKSIRIGKHPDPIWQENYLHRMVYSVSLYSSEKDWKQPEAPKRIAPKKAPKKKKKGLAKFFDDLFS